MRVVIIWFIEFNGVVNWSLCWRGLASTFRASLCNITDLYHYAMLPLKTFYTQLSWAPEKCFK